MKRLGCINISSAPEERGIPYLRHTSSAKEELAELPGTVRPWSIEMVDDLESYPSFMPSYTGLARVSITYDHIHWRTRDPVRSPLDKPMRAGLVVGSVTTSEYPVLYVF